MIEKYFEIYGIIDEGNIVDDADLETDDSEIQVTEVKNNGDSI